VGRSKERINIHGLKYDPSEFEAPLFKVAGLRKGCFAAFGVDDPVRGTQTLVLLAEVDDPIERPHKAIADDVRHEVAVHVGVTIGDLLLVPKGFLTKTSSGKRRHTFFKELYLQKGLKTLYEQPAKDRIKDNREYPRKDCQADVIYSKNNRLAQGMIVNISAGGLYIYTDSPFAVGQEITLRFEHPFAEKQIKVNGKIVRNDHKGIGVKFEQTIGNIL
jgi:hypothetical protein